MLNISYKSVSQNENFKQSIKNNNINKDKLEGVFIINEFGNFKPVRLLLKYLFYELNLLGIYVII